MTEETEFIRLGDRSIRRISLESQTQYLSMYAHRTNLRQEYKDRIPNLGEGLRFRNLDALTYHHIEIHKDDAEKFVRRVNQYMIEQGMVDQSLVDENYLRKWEE